MRPSERKILNNLEDFFDGRTILFCTHRTSFIEKSTRVLILDKKGIKLDMPSKDYLSKIASLKTIDAKKIG